MHLKAYLPHATLALTLITAPVSLHAAQNNHAQTQQKLNKQLDKKQYKNVKATFKGDMVTLTGTVPTYNDKQEAEKRVKHVNGIHGIDNEIQVASTGMSDRELAEKLTRSIQNSRIGYGTTAFNAISVRVQNGSVLLGGHAYGPVDASTAVSIASNMKGVKDVTDNIQVDPVSPMDNRIRRAAYRTIYGFPSLNKYAINPAQPIRISVQNGHITLYGVVDSKADKEAAGIRANTVPGVFSVTNNLQVANGESNK